MKMKRFMMSLMIKELLKEVRRKSNKKARLKLFRAGMEKREDLVKEEVRE